MPSDVHTGGIFMKYVRVRRLDGEKLVCEFPNTKPQEGTIGTAETWSLFIESLPASNGKKNRPVALVTHADDLEFKRAIDASTVLGYTWDELVRWLDKLAEPRPRLNTDALSRHKQTRW